MANSLEQWAQTQVRPDSYDNSNAEVPGANLGGGQTLEQVPYGGMINRRSNVDSWLSQMGAQAGLPSNFDWRPYLLQVQQSFADKGMQGPGLIQNQAILPILAAQAAAKDYPQLAPVVQSAASPSSSIWQGGEEAASGIRGKNKQTDTVGSLVMMAVGGFFGAAAAGVAAAGAGASGSTAAGAGAAGAGESVSGVYGATAGELGAAGAFAPPAGAATAPALAGGGSSGALTAPAAGTMGTGALGSGISAGGAGTAGAGGGALAGGAAAGGAASSIPSWLPTLAGAAIGAFDGSKQKNTTTTQVNDPWSGVQPYLSKGYGAAAGILDQGYPQDTQAMLRARGMLGSPVNQEAQNLASSTMRGDYLNSNPFLDKSVQDAMGMAQSRINSQFASNNFGSSAHQEWLGRGLMNAALPAMSQNYENERGRQFAAMSQAPALQDMDYQNLGAIQQADQMPWDFLGRYQQIVSGLPSGGGTTTTQKPYFTNPYSSAMGGAIMGNQLYRSYQNQNTPYGFQNQNTPYGF